MFFVALFVEHLWVRKFLFLYEGANIVRRWGSTKVPGSGFLGFVTSGLLNLQKGIFFFFFFYLSRVLSHSLIKSIPYFSICLPVE